MIQIRLFLLGYIWDFDVAKVAKLLNTPSGAIKVEILDPVRNIGDPDLFGMGYSHRRLFQMFPKQSEDQLLVGITSAPIEDNLFSKSKGNNAIIITLFGTDEHIETSDRTHEEYVVHTLLSEMLWIQYKMRNPTADYSSLFHQATRGCIFDYCTNKSDISVGLKTCLIDPMCKGRLIEGNVPQSLVDSTEHILHRIRTPSFIRTLELGLQKPLFSFILGGLIFGLVINVLSSLMLGDFDSSTDYVVTATMIGASLLLVISNYLSIRFQSRKVNL